MKSCVPVRASTLAHCEIDAALEPVKRKRGRPSKAELAARELRGRADLIVYSCSWWNLPLGDAVKGLFSAEEHRFGVHAGEIETAMMLALAPDQVVMGAAQDFDSASRQRAGAYPILGNGRSAKLGWAMEDYNAHGAAGNAAVVPGRGACADRQERCRGAPARVARAGDPRPDPLTQDLWLDLTTSVTFSGHQVSPIARSARTASE